MWFGYGIEGDDTMDILMIFVVLLMNDLLPS
jgi:hypothetical protein